MARRVIEIVEALTRTTGQAPLDVVRDLLGEDADEILADCIVRHFIEPIRQDGRLYLTALGSRCTEKNSKAGCSDLRARRA